MGVYLVWVFEVKSQKENYVQANARTTKFWKEERCKST